MTLQIGDRTTLKRTILEQDLELFATLSLDRNRIHFDQKFARDSYFGKPIAHGMIGASLISGALTRLMGDGNIWLDATIQFEKPVFIGDRLKILLVVREITRRGVASIDVNICNSQNKTVIKGSVTSMQVVQYKK